MDKKIWLALAIFLTFFFAINTFALDPCPKELIFSEKNGKFFGSSESGLGEQENKIIFNNYGQGCGMNQGDYLIVYAQSKTKNPDGTDKTQKTPLLKITMVKYYVDLFDYQGEITIDDDAWDFNFSLLKPDSVELTKQKENIREYSAKNAEYTRTDVKFSDGTPAFHVALNMDSDASWDGQLDKIYVEAKIPVADLLKLLAADSTPSCSIETSLIDEEPAGIDMGDNFFDNCKFGTKDVFENLFDKENKKISLNPAFNFGSTIGVFVSPNPQQICLINDKARERKWSTEKTNTSKCYPGEALSQTQISSLKTAFDSFYNTFPKETVEKYLKSIFAAKQIKPVKQGDSPDSSFNGAAIEMKTFLYSASCETINPDAVKKTAFHEFSHLMDFQQCFIFGAEGDQKDPTNGKLKYTGLKAKDFYAMNKYNEYLGSDYEKNATDRDGFVPVKVSKYAQKDLAEDFAETSAYLLMNNEDTKLISDKAETDSLLKQKILLIEEMWSEASNGKMDRAWWCDKIGKLDIDCSVPAENMNDAIQKMNKKLLKDIGFN